MTRLNAKALVFDFDGVLAETESLHWKAWATLLRPYGVTLTWEDYCRVGKGINDEQMLRTLFRFSSDSPILSKMHETISRKKEMVRSWCSLQSPISSSTVRMLNELQAFRLGLVTSSDRDEVEPLLRAAGIHTSFGAIVYADDTKRHKPDSEPYLLVRERLAIQTGIVFEDSDSGLESALTAGFIAIRVDRPENLPAIVKGSLS